MKMETSKHARKYNDNDAPPPGYKMTIIQERLYEMALQKRVRTETLDAMAMDTLLHELRMCQRRIDTYVQLYPILAKTT